MRRARRGATISIVLGLVLASRTSGALTPAEGAMRRQLIAEAAAAHNGGNHAKALSLAQRASALEATPSLHYFIAREEEETGALADGYATAQQCAVEAERDPKLHGRDEIVKKCHEIEWRLKERVGYVVVDVKDRPAGLQVKLSGQELNEAALGIPYVITPGTIVVEATAPAHSPYRLEISVPEGKTINVSVTLAPKPPEAAADACPAGQRLGPENSCVTDTCQVGMMRTTDGAHCCWPGQTWQTQVQTCTGSAVCPGGTRAEGDGCVVDATARLQTPAAAPDSGPAAVVPMVSINAAPPGEDGSRRGMRPAYGLALGAVGAAIVVGSAVVWLISDSDFNSAKQSCNNPPHCSISDYNNDVSTVQRLDKVAVTGFIVGGALTVAGGIFYWWADRSEGRRNNDPRAWLDVDPLNRAARLYLRF